MKTTDKIGGYYKELLREEESERMSIHVFEFMKQFFLRNSVEEPVIEGTIVYIYPRLLEECLKENRLANQRSALSTRRISDTSYVRKVADSGKEKHKISEILKSFNFRKRFTV